MSAPTPDEFWHLLVRSQLLAPDAAAALRAEHAAAAPAAVGDGSVKAIAGWLCRRGVLTRWQAKRLAGGDGGPLRIGDYRLMERHPRDGDGLLFTARHDPSGRLVFLMLLNGRRCQEVDTWKEIVRRTTAAQRAADPLLSRTASLEQQGGSRFIVCEHVAGVSLADEFERSGPLPPEQACTLALQVATAVAELHGLGIVHGGLSLDALRREATPDGMEQAGRVRLLQFPLAGDPHRVPLRPLVANDAELVRLGRRAAFVSPELLAADATCNERSDVYAIGAILVSLLTGSPPWWDGDPRSTLQRASFQCPALLPSTIPPTLAAVVGRMMDRDPARRYRSAGEAADALAACLGLSAPSAGGSREEATEPPPASDMPRFVVEPPRRPAVRRSGPWGMIVAGVVVAMLAGSVIVVLGRQEWRKPAAPAATSRRESRAIREDPSGDTTLAAVPVAGQPADQPPGISAGSPAAATRQIVVDDSALPWASPTSGPPPTLAYLPPGSQLIMLARLAEISADGEGRLFLESLGPAAGKAIAALVKLCGGEIADIESVQAGWQAGEPDELVAGYAVRFVEGRTAPADEASRRTAWGETTEVAVEGETVYRSPTLSFWVPSAEQGRVLVIASTTMLANDVTLGPGGGPQTEREPLIEAIVRESLAADPTAGTAPAAMLPRDLEVLVGMLDSDRHVTVLGSPRFLVNAGRPLLAGPLGRGVEPIAGLLGESVQAAALSLHFGDNSYVEMDAVPSLEVPARKRAAEIAAQVDGLAAQVEGFCTSLDPDPYGRMLVLRLPAMVRAAAAQVRAGAEGQGVVLNAYLPRHAPHNLALAAEIALAQSPTAASNSK